MLVVIDEITYRENDIVNYDNSYGHIKGIIKYGEWVQNSSGGEYRCSYCYGWYVQFVDLTPFASAYFCRDLLPKDLIIEKLVEYERLLRYVEYDQRLCSKFRGFR